MTKLGTWIFSISFKTLKNLESSVNAAFAWISNGITNVVMVMTLRRWNDVVANNVSKWGLSSKERFIE